MDLCSGEETEITDYFKVERVFSDDNGEAQIDWSLTNVPFDFGTNLIYLKVNQLIGETFYSNAFQLTDYDSNRTCRIDYRNNDIDTMQSVQLQMFFWQDLKTTELSTYYETSTRNTVTTTVKSQKHERWVTEFISNDLLIKITDVFENKFVYVDLERCYLFEAVEVPEHEHEADFEESTIKLAFNKNDVYDPLYVEPVTNIPSITLNSVEANGVNAIYDFDLENFNPTYLNFQGTQDINNWAGINKGVSSPQSVPFNEIGTWYFRIVHPEAISNVIQLDLGSNVEAVNDNVSIGKGQSIDISVLFNDVLVGNTYISTVSNPTNGTVAIIESGTKIRYTHNDSATSSDSFTYTITNGISSDTATVYVSVLAESKDFLMFDYAGTKPQHACSVGGNSTIKFHSGSSQDPQIGDTVYIDYAQNNVFVGFDKYYKISGGKVIKINNVGVVTDVQFC